MTRRLLSVLAAILTLSLAPVASAYVDINGFYLSDALKISTANSTSRMIFEGSVGFAIDKKKKYSVGWNYSMHSAQDKKGGVTEKYTGSQMGPRFVYVLDKNNAWTLGLGYYLVSKAKYDDGAGNTPEWKGTAFKVDFGYNFPLAENFYAGIRLNYSSAKYSEQLVQSTTYSNVSYARSMMYPSIYSVFVF